MWVFGYGSLIFRPSFAFSARRVARLRGHARRFFQGSPDHRGTELAPGRVVTLVDDPEGAVLGVAYEVLAGHEEAAMAELSHREKAGYETRSVTLETDGGAVEALVFLAAPGNADWLGPAPLDEMAAHIARSVGPSGRNDAYLFALEAALDELGADDVHVRSLAAAVRARSAVGLPDMRFLIGSVVVSCFVACSPGNQTSPDVFGGSGAGGTDAAGAAGAPGGAGGAATGTGGAGAPDAQAGAGGGIVVNIGGATQDAPPTIYAHTGTTLFSLDPSTNKLDKIGDFDCTDSVKMTDIAVDKDKNLVGVLSSGVTDLTIGTDGTVHCGDITPFEDTTARYYGLTFAPAGTLDPTKEALIAANTAGELWQIGDDKSLTQRGTFGLVPEDDGNGHTYPKDHIGTAWSLSGDIVFLTGDDGSAVGFATVRDCTDPDTKSTCGNADTLLEIDVPKLATATTGTVVKAVRGLVVQRQDASCMAPDGGVFGNMYGIGAWGSSVYGFSTLGDLVEIDVNDGSGCLTKTFSGTSFAGAGVTTKAKVAVPMLK